MPFTHEEGSRLIALMEEIRGRKEHPYAAPTYRDTPALLEMEHIVLSHAGSDSDSLRDTIHVLWFLSESYQSMGRSKVAEPLWEQLLLTYQTLHRISPLDDKERRKFDDALRECVRCRNYFYPDTCSDLMRYSDILGEESTQAKITHYATHLTFALKHDPVEATPEYLAVIDEVEKLVEEHMEFDHCFEAWRLKTMYLKERGIVWHDPHVLNPRVMFD